MSILNDYIAKQGRGGDTELRYVDDKLSHVNTAEAYLIDNYGELGEATTKTIGSGTINPNTGLPEYSWGSTIGGLATGVGTGLLLASGPIGWSTAAAIGGGAGAGILTSIAANNKDTVWRPSKGHWGIFGKDASAIAAEKKAKHVAGLKQDYIDNPNKTAGLADLHGKDLDFASMSEEEKKRIFGDVMKFESDFEWSNKNIDAQVAMMGQYDETDELRARDKAHDTLSDYGTEATTSLLGLTQQAQQTQSRRGYATTGQPTIDRNRKNIFEKVTGATQNVWEGFQDTKEDLRDDYSQQWVSRLAKMAGNL